MYERKEIDLLIGVTVWQRIRIGLIE